jgi:hypothetical protein
VATNIAHVDSLEANYFINGYVNAPVQSNIGDPIVNQSFTAFGATVSQQQTYDSAFDNYAAQFNVLFVTAAGNGGTIYPPGTAYNSICVGCYQGYSSTGPTPDNGRCKPDITAPPGEIAPDTSYSTPLVSGAAALLEQAAIRGDGGSDTNSAADIRTLKALLLNGAVKPSDWTNATFSPLDLRYGTGLVNVFNSYEQLAFGKHGAIVSNSVTSGSPHPPTGATGTVGALSGWDFGSVSSTAGSIFPPSPATDGVKHYFFNVTNHSGRAAFSATITLAWNRPNSGSSSVQSAINNLGLFLYNTANSNLVMVSTSKVDNVQHIFVPSLDPGRYDLQVWKAGGSGIVSASESYALAWAFTAQSLTVAQVGSSVVLSWPPYPADFRVEAATNLETGPWIDGPLPLIGLVNGTNTMQLPMDQNARFFRLKQPNF